MNNNLPGLFLHVTKKIFLTDISRRSFLIIVYRKDNKHLLNIINKLKMGQFRTYVRRLRETRNISQREVGDFIQSNTAFVCLMEKGDRQASREQVLRLAEFFQVDVEKLLTMWLSEKICFILANEDEKTIKKAIRIAEKELFPSKEN